MTDPNIGDRLRAVARLATEHPSAQASPCPVMEPNIGDRLRAVARLATEPPSTQASPCPVTCWRCGADCVWREHYYREPLAVGAMLSMWREACCSRCSWTDRPLDTYEGERHPEG